MEACKKKDITRNPQAQGFQGRRHLLQVTHTLQESVGTEREKHMFLRPRTAAASSRSSCCWLRLVATWWPAPAGDYLAAQPSALSPKSSKVSLRCDAAMWTPQSRQMPLRLAAKPSKSLDSSMPDLKSSFAADLALRHLQSGSRAEGGPAMA